MKLQLFKLSALQNTRVRTEEEEKFLKTALAKFWIQSYRLSFTTNGPMSTFSDGATSMNKPHTTSASADYSTVSAGSVDLFTTSTLNESESNNSTSIDDESTSTTGNPLAAPRRSSIATGFQYYGFRYFLNSNWYSYVFPSIFIILRFTYDTSLVSFAAAAKIQLAANPQAQVSPKCWICTWQ